MNWIFQPFFGGEIDVSIDIWVTLAQKWDGVVAFCGVI
jgi:hypothetical protein